MRKRRVRAGLAAVAAALLAGCGGPRLPTRQAGETVLTVLGMVKFGPLYLQRSDLAALPRTGFQSRPPGQPAGRYEGVSVLWLVTERLQPEPGADVLVLVTRDGVAIPIGPGLLKQYGPILADSRDGQPIPLQLAWPNQAQRGLDADPRAAVWWSAPVVTIEVLSWDKTWGRQLRPPPGIGDAARRGAGQYSLRCAPCHRLHGVGGERGPALDRVIGRLGRPAFQAAMARHPGWPAWVGNELESGEDVAGQVALFLAAAEQAGPPPPEEGGRPPAPKAAQQPSRFGPGP